jgi:hypothetical protein
MIMINAKFFKLLLAVIAFAMFIAPAARVHAANGLEATVRAHNPLKPVLVLTNSSQQACQVAGTSVGTVAITEFRQDGKIIQPEAMDGAADDSLELFLRSQLKTLEPSQSAEIPLSVYPFQGGHSLETVAWSTETGSFRTIYQIKPDKPLELTLNYNVPIATAEGAPLCGFAQASSIGGGPSLPWIVGGVGGLVALIALVIWFVVKHRQRLRKLLHRLRRPFAAFVLLGIAGSILLGAAPVRALYTVPPEIQDDWDRCMSIFREHTDITGPVLNALDNARQGEVVHTTHDGPNDSAGTRELGYYRVYWNPDSTYRYHDGNAQDPCTSLYHELYHNYEIAQGTLDIRQCGSSGISIKEVNATRAENRLRERLGMPQRTTYDRYTLPEGECTPPPEPGSCTSGSCGDSNGDPHLVTFDGEYYDFQAVGEFVAATDNSGQFEVQVRQQPWADSRRVSVNTAAALQVGTDKVELRIDGRSLQLIVNGEEEDFSAQTLPDGGSIAPSGDSKGTVMWPDGSSVTVRAIGTFGVHVVVDPSEDKKDKLEGLFGNFDGNRDNDLTLRGSDEVVEETFEALYPKFADSWRVTNDSSLFTYGNGTNTETYTDRSLPESRVTAADLPNRAAAERICRSMGITEETVLANCVLDVALTGRPEFASAARVTQGVRSSEDYGGTVYPISIKNPGDTATITFEAKAGDRIFADVFGTTFLDQCGVLTLHGPQNKPITSGCILDGRGMLDGTTLPDAGTHTITVKPRNNQTGEAKVRLIFIKDTTVGITPDGDTQTISIDKPGVIGRLTFEGKTGQRVFVEVPSSTLPNQCGVLDLKGPDGRAIRSGCILNGRGLIDTTVLEATGTYTINVDPAQRGTGSATVKMHLVAERSAALSINGPSATIQFTKPGDTAVWRFSGNADQKVHIDITGSGINQCGGITLIGPDSKTIHSGCLLDGKGDIGPDAGNVLPATGNYTILVDPHQTSTGQVTVDVSN